jgi:hypothetical protein
MHSALEIERRMPAVGKSEQLRGILKGARHGESEADLTCDNTHAGLQIGRAVLDAVIPTLNSGGAGFYIPRAGWNRP